MKEQIKAPEKIPKSNEEIASLSDAEFKTLVIRILTGITEYKCKIEEKVKAMQSEIKESIQGTDSEGKAVSYTHYRTLWVSPMNSPVSLGVSSAAATLTGFFSQRF